MNDAFTLDRFAQALDAGLEQLPAAARPPRLCVALSGGLDSSVLLAALADLRQSGAPSARAVRALHVDHSLHPDSARWDEASRALAASLGVVDEIVREPLGGAHRDPQAMADALKAALLQHLETVEALSDDELLARRYERLRNQGVYRTTP